MNHKVGDLVCRFGPHWSDKKIYFGVITSRWDRYNSIIETRYTIEWNSNEVSSWDDYSENDVLSFKSNLKAWLLHENKH